MSRLRVDSFESKIVDFESTAFSRTCFGVLLFLFPFFTNKVTVGLTYLTTIRKKVIKSENLARVLLNKKRKEKKQQEPQQH